MAHPYFVYASVFDDVPKADEERDADTITRFGEEADDEIDNLIKNQIEVPLTTNIDVLNTSSTLRTEGKFYNKIGERTRGSELIAQSDKIIQEWITTFKKTRAPVSAYVQINDGIYNDFTNSPLITD